MHSLYLLPNNNLESLTAAQMMINGGNAVLLYPDPMNTSSSSAGSRKYKACFIRNGNVLRNNVQRHPSSGDLIIEVAMGDRKINVRKSPPCDITLSIPNAANLCKMALAKAGIVIAPVLQTPQDVFQALQAPKMDDKSLAAFATSSFYARKLAQPILDHRAVKKLFEHIRDGAIGGVKNILEAKPELALVEWKAAKGKEEEKVFANKAGQLISVEGKTAYEFALGEEDTEIAAELRACIVKVKDQEVANKLFHKQYPEGWKKEEAKKSAPMFTQLDVLTQAIRNAQPGDIISSGDPDYRLTVLQNSAVATALAKCRSMLDEMLNEPVTTGRHFNSNLLLRAFQIYDNHYEDYFGNSWGNPKAMLFWQQAIGYIQRFMPANFVQAFCNGLYISNEKLQKSMPKGRLLRFKKYDTGSRDWVNSDFYPLSNSGLGFDFAIYGGLAHRIAGGGWAAVSEFMSIKNSRLTELTQHQDRRDEASKSCCAIM